MSLEESSQGKEELEILVGRLRKELAECDQARAAGERSIETERRQHLEAITGADGRTERVIQEKNSLEAELFEAKTRVRQIELQGALGGESSGVEDGEGGVVWDQP